MYVVLEGDHVVDCDGQDFRLGPGGLVFLPRCIPHAHRRLVPGVGRLLCLLAPGGLEGFLSDDGRGGRQGMLVARQPGPGRTLDDGTAGRPAA